MTRAKRRHHYQVRKKAVVRRFSTWDGINESHICQSIDTTIWKNYERMFGRPAKPSDRRADISMKEQLKEFRLQEAA